MIEKLTERVQSLEQDIRQCSRFEKPVGKSEFEAKNRTRELTELKDVHQHCQRAISEDKAYIDKLEGVFISSRRFNQSQVAYIISLEAEVVDLTNERAAEGWQLPTILHISDRGPSQISISDPGDQVSTRAD